MEEEHFIEALRHSWAIKLAGTDGAGDGEIPQETRIQRQSLATHYTTREIASSVVQ